MTTPLDEVKIRAKLLQKAFAQNDAALLQKARPLCLKRGWSVDGEWTLSRCLNLAAAGLGFQHWEHVRSVLGAAAKTGEDMGEFWYDEACWATFNNWCATHAEAQAAMGTHAERFVIPYGRQFVVVDANFIAALGLDARDPYWTALGRDLVQGYGSVAWNGLVLQRLAARRGRLL